MQLFHTQSFQITPLAVQDLVTPSVDLATDTTSMLASVPAAKLAKLESRVARVPLPSESDEDISGSDSDPADPDYLPKDYDKESSLASDSSDDEVVLTLLMQLFNSFFPSSPQSLPEALLTWCSLPPGPAGCPWRTWGLCTLVSW